MRIDGKRVIITGASAGIGRALATALGRRGAVLTLAARREERLADVAREVAERCPGLAPPAVVRCDVSKPASVTALVGGTVERLGSVDILINDAGISVYGKEARTSIEDYREVMSVNFFGALHGMREALQFMRRQGSGLIVNVSSVAALHGVPFLAAYCASKAALLSVSQALRAELHESGVRIMVVYPGYTATEIFEQEKKVGGAKRPPGEYASAVDVAEAIVRGIERDIDDLYLTVRGRALSALRGVAPAVINRAMRKIARELEDPDAPVSDDKAH